MVHAGGYSVLINCTSDRYSKKDWTWDDVHEVGRSPNLVLDQARSCIIGPGTSGRLPYQKKVAALVLHGLAALAKVIKAKKKTPSPDFKAIMMIIHTEYNLCVVRIALQAPTSNLYVEYNYPVPEYVQQYVVVEPFPRFIRSLTLLHVYIPYRALPLGLPRLRLTSSCPTLKSMGTLLGLRTSPARCVGVAGVLFQQYYSKSKCIRSIVILNKMDLYEV